MLDRVHVVLDQPTFGGDHADHDRVDLFRVELKQSRCGRGRSEARSGHRVVIVLRRRVLDVVRMGVLEAGSDGIVEGIRRRGGRSVGRSGRSETIRRGRAARRDRLAPEAATAGLRRAPVEASLRWCGPSGVPGVVAIAASAGRVPLPLIVGRRALERRAHDGPSKLPRPSALALLMFRRLEGLRRAS